jgi:hypothetical protein
MSLSTMAGRQHEFSLEIAPRGPPATVEAAHCSGRKASPTDVPSLKLTKKNSENYQTGQNTDQGPSSPLPSALNICVHNTMPLFCTVTDMAIPMRRMPLKLDRCVAQKWACRNVHLEHICSIAQIGSKLQAS